MMNPEDQETRSRMQELRSKMEEIAEKLRQAKIKITKATEERRSGKKTIDGVWMQRHQRWMQALKED